MKLSQIKLSGFKSFVDHSVINISGQLVGIVGPNGCGKSNVVDAVRWVLGESSAKQLRGESMHDVIFNGSTTRNPISRASVELVFDNQHKILSNAWNSFNEISIKRILTRSGDATYLINNQPVRRKDIAELFLGTGVGNKGYAVIEQGMIAKIIDADPKELRMYLEEAAGVSKYREKRKETLSRLDYTQENLVRLEDIKTQLNDNINNLTTQAQIATHYQDLTLKLKNSQLVLLLIKIDKANKALSIVNQDINNSEQLIEQIVKEDSLAEITYTEQQQLKAMIDLQLQILNEQFNQLRSHSARLEERHKYKLEAQNRLQTEEDNLKEQILELDRQIIVYTDNLVQIQQSIELEVDMVAKKDSLRQNEYVKFADLEDNYQKSVVTISTIASRVIDRNHELDLLNNSLQHKQQQLKNLQARVLKLEQEMPANSLALDQSHTILQEEILNLNLSVEETVTLLEDKRNIYQETNIYKSSQLNEIHQYTGLISATNAKITTLDRLLQQSSKTEQIDKVVPNFEQLIPLWQVIEVSTGYEIAVEVILGSILSSFTVDNLHELFKEPLNTLCLWHGNTRNAVEIKPGTLSVEVKISNPKYQGLYLLLNEYIVTKDFTSALTMLESAQSKIVTMDGHILTPEYVIFNAHHGQSNVLEYQNQILGLTNELNEYNEKLEQLNLEHNKSSELIRILDLELLNLEKSKASLIKQKHDLELEFTRQEQSHLYTIRHHEKVTTELAIMSKETGYIQDEVVTLEEKKADQIIQAEHVKIEQENLQDAHLQLERLYKTAKANLDGIDLQINNLSTNLRLLEQNKQTSLQLLEEKKIQLANIYTKLTNMELDKDSLSVSDERIEIELVTEQITQVVEKIEEQNAKLIEVNTELSQVKDNKTKLAIDKEKLVNKLNQDQLARQEHVLSIQNLEENIINLEVTEYFAPELLAENKLSLSTLQEKIVSLRQEIDGLGLVNLKAIEDLKLAQDKFTELSLQIEDLTSANAALVTAIQQIDQESRKLLNDTYIKANEKFNYYFKILFGGGQASLSMTEEDILLSGIHIIASPLGKKNTSLHLLSGGEKALTAMSLVFALFSLNPSPFCILDEVDAPLDDANTARFCHLVQELSVNTQFIYISHNRLTMEIANQLIGVTMQEKGVSTIVSVNLVDQG